MKRSPIARTSELRRAPIAAGLAVAAPKPRRCKVCRKPAMSRAGLLPFCSPECGLVLAQRERAKQKTAEASKERATTRERKEAIKTRKEVEAEVQVAFNAFIRLRDFGLPCICCGKPMEPDRPGGAVDAGHYLSRGAACNLRFDEANVHAQRKSCNRPGGTTRAAFRAGMVARVGMAEVERLESDQTPRKHDIEILREMRSHYRAKAKALKKQLETA